MDWSVPQSKCCQQYTVCLSICWSCNWQLLLLQDSRGRRCQNPVGSKRSLNVLLYLKLAGTYGPSAEPRVIYCRDKPTEDKWTKVQVSAGPKTSSSTSTWFYWSPLSQQVRAEPKRPKRFWTIVSVPSHSSVWYRHLQFLHRGPCGQFMVLFGSWSLEE